MKRLHQKRRYFSLLVLVSFLAQSCCVFASESGNAGSMLDPLPLPLGERGLMETRESVTIAPGVTHYTIRRGRFDPETSWALSTGVSLTEQDVKRAESCIAALGLRPMVSSFAAPGESGVEYHVVRGGSFEDRAHARSMRKRSKAVDCTLSSQNTAEDVQNLTGPWVVNVLVIDPKRFHGQILPALANAGALGHGERTSQIAIRSKAIAAINGGFFVEHSKDGFPGEPAGISMLNGRVMNEPRRFRPALVFSRRGPVSMQIAEWSNWSMALKWSDGQSTAINGVNRKPGVIRNCGELGDKPTDDPAQDFTCTNPNEIVYFEPNTKFHVDGIKGQWFALKKDGGVDAINNISQLAPEDGLLIATGLAGEAVRAHVVAHQHARLMVSGRFVNDEIADLSAVNAGPTLLRKGAEIHAEAHEGWSIDALSDLSHRNLMHDWINRRNPRTAAGIRADGTLLLVTVDGHASSRSVGVTIEELRKLMTHLGARDAVNLDGGGSTTMVIDGKVVNAPTDAAGERQVGDAILILPQQQAN